MHIIRPTAFTHQHTTDEHVSFTGERGEQFRVTVLDDALVRVQHLPQGTPQLTRTWSIVDSDGTTPREGRRRDDLSPFALPGFDFHDTDDAWLLSTDELQVRVNKQHFNLEWYSAGGKLFAADVRGRAYAYDSDSGAVYHYLYRFDGEYYYGFGERSGALHKAGRRFVMKNVDALGYNAETSDPLYKHFPFYITFIPEENIAYGLFYDNLSTAVFDMGKEIDAFWGDYRYYQAVLGDLDYYLIYGDSIAAVLERLTALIGRPVLPPRWSLGYLGSTMAYTEAKDAQAQLKRFGELCAEHDIPCDMFHLSSGYTTNDVGERRVFTWNRERIPDPQQMVDNFHAHNIRLSPNIKPHLLKTHPNYDDVREAGGFIMDADGEAPAESIFWSGGAFEWGEGAYLDFTSAAGFDWWKAQATAALLDYGIDSLWNDNNEYELWNDSAQCAGFGDPLPLGQVRPLHALLMAQASYEALHEARPDERPFVISRSGSPGIQRYAQTWSGDNDTSWHALRWNIPMGLSMGLSGVPSHGHDVGGFHGGKPSPELFVRWVQNGVLHPRFTIHSWNTDGTVNEPWMYPEMLPFVRGAIQLRYRLLPYLYTLFYEAHTTGHPIIRPMVYHYPQDAHTHTESFDFMLGANLLVASVLELEARTREIYLPDDGAGLQWCDFYTGEWHAGGQSITVAAPLDRVPLLVPAGGMIPLGKLMRYVGESPDDERTLLLFPSPASTIGESTFTLVEDDGISWDYQQGAVTRLHITMTTTEDAIRLQIGKLQEGYPLPYDALTCVLPPAETRPLSISSDHTATVLERDAQGRRQIRISL